MINTNFIESLITKDNDLLMDKTTSLMNPIVKVPMGSLKKLLQEFDSPPKEGLKGVGELTKSRKGLLKKVKPETAFSNDSL